MTKFCHVCRFRYILPSFRKGLRLDFTEKTMFVCYLDLAHGHSYHHKILCQISSYRIHCYTLYYGNCRNNSANYIWILSQWTRVGGDQQRFERHQLCASPLTEYNSMISRWNQILKVLLKVNLFSFPSAYKISFRCSLHA